MTGKKGFTLIELLAVIVILGIIMVIAVPSLTELIQKFRREAFVNSVKFVIDEINNGINSSNQDLSGYYSVSSGEVQGESPFSFNKKLTVSGEFNINSESLSYTFNSDNFCVHKSHDSNRMVFGDYSTGDCDIVTKESCFLFDEVSKKITGYDSKCGTDVVIPDLIRGITVEGIGAGAFYKKFYYNKNLNKIIYTGTSIQDWGKIINTTISNKMVTGTVTNEYGDVIVSAN